MKRIPVLIAAIFLGASLPSAAIAGGNHGGHSHGGHSHGESAIGLPTAGIDSTEGEITRIDKDTGQVFIKHGDMRKIGLLAMLMVFNIRDVSMLDRVTVGDKVRFTVERNGAQLTVTQLDPIR